MKPGLTLQQRQSRLAWVFLAPALALILAVGLYPLLRTFWLSFTNADAGVDAVAMAGFSNYSELLGNRDFRHSIINTIVFTVCSVSLEFCLGLGLALIVNSGFKGRSVVRAAMLIPWALPTVVAARMWGWMLNDQYGVVNDVLFRKLGLISSPIAWTGQDGWAMFSVIMVDVWKTTPFMALLLLAGLQLIPRGLYEAAEVDGAGPVQRFFAVTLPLLKPAILVALIFRSLDALRVFDVIWVMTEGRFGTESMATFAYRNLFNYGRLGYGSAISVVIFLVIAAFVILYVSAVRMEKEES